jgi:ABC-type branched-subunit amino acid transport system ATPase component
VLRLVAAAAFACAGFAAAFALAPWLWLAVVANMAIGTTLAIIGPGIFAGLSLAIPPRARSMGFSLGALWVIPGLVVLPAIGLLSDGIGIQAGMLVLLPVFVVGGLIVASGADQLPADIQQVRTQAVARSEHLYERRQGRAELLLCRGLDVGYGDVQVLFGVDLEVVEGEIVALLGTNGAAKSTLLQAICGVVEADKGAVVFDGRDITHTPPEEIARLGVTLMPGGQGVFPSLTVQENLRMAGWLHRERSEGVDQVLDRFPVLAQRLDEPAANLSGGQQQMLALGMAFVARPRLLLIDELSLGLAPAVVEQLLPMLRTIRDPALRRRTRRFGIVHLSGGHEVDDLAPLEVALADRGVTLARAVAYASPVDLQRDAPAVVARLREAGVTSVLFAGDPIAPAALTRAATEQGWFPEWVVIGAGYTDSTLFARTYGQRQWAHAFGVTFLPARVDPASEGGEGATDLYRWFHGHAPPAASAGLTVLDLELLYGAVQGAGPELTPRTFQQALFGGPPTPAGDVTFPVLSWGDHGLWPSTDHGGIDDATLVWWNPRARGPDEAGDHGTGMYEYVDGGRRYLPGEWPTAPLPLFAAEGAVAIYDRPPPVAAVAERRGTPQ